MKKLLLISSLLLATISLSAQQPTQLPTDPNVRVGKLDNGLTYYIRHNELPKQRAEFHIAQAVGAILEEDNQNGLAHFLEHMAFNGTEHFPGKGIINYFESIGVNFGGNINAYTSLDETVYRLSEVPTIREGIIDSALLVLHDWSHSLLLEGDEIDAERGVIREEWRTGASAERRMWKELNPLTYPNSQYAKRDVIGDTAVINNFKYDELRSYYQRWYGPDLQAVIVVGDIDVDQIEQKIKTLWADVPERSNRGERPIYTIDDNDEPIVAIVKDREAQVTRIRIDFKKQQLPEELKNTDLEYFQNIANSLICQMLDSRFEELTMSPKSAIVGGGCGYDEIVKQKDAFIALIAAKQGQEKEALNQLLTEIEKMHRYGFTESELERAKIELLNEYEQSYNERNTTRNIVFTHEYIRNFLDGDCIPGIEWEYQFIQQILPALSVDLLNQLAKEYVTEQNIIVSLTAPEKEHVQLPTEDEVLAAIKNMPNLEIEAPVEEEASLVLVSKAPKASKIKKISKNSELGTTELLLKNNVRVVIKPTEFKQDEIIMSAYSEGGSSLITDTDLLPSAELATDIANMSGIGNLNAIQLQKALAGKTVNINLSINKTSETIEGASSVKDFETLLELTNLSFTRPRFDDDAYQTLVHLLETQLINKESNSKAIFRDSIYAVANNHSPRLVLWNKETLQNISLSKAQHIYTERFKDPSDFIFTFTGNIDPDDIATQKLISQWLGSIKTSKKNIEHFADNGIRVPSGKTLNYFDRDMQIKTASNRIQFTSYDIPYSLSAELNMEVLGRVLDIRYLESIREREGGSYGVGVAGYLSRRPIATATLLMQFDTDPDKQDRLMQIIYEEVEQIAKEGPLADDLMKAKGAMLKDFEEDIEKNSFWDSFILPEYYIHNQNYLTEYEDAVKSVTAETVKETLNELLKSGNVFEVVMFPKAKPVE